MLSSSDAGPRLHSYHLDAVGVSDQLVDVKRLAAQPRRVVLQDDAFAGAAVQAVGRLSFCCTCRREEKKGNSLVLKHILICFQARQTWMQRVQNEMYPETRENSWS